MRLSRSFFVNIKIFEDERNLANFLLTLTIAFTLSTDIISQHGTQDDMIHQNLQIYWCCDFLLHTIRINQVSYQESENSMI